MNFASLIIVFGLCISAMAKDSKQAPKESANLKEARALFLENKRPEAIQQLLSANPPLHEEALRLSERFLTEVAQREFEMAESLRYSRSAAAKAAYKKALAAEPHNLLVQQSLLLLSVEEESCELAETYNQDIQKVFPEHPRAPYFQLLISRCKAEIPLVPEITVKAEALNPKFLQLQQAHIYIVKQQFHLAEPLIKKLLEGAGTPPEVYLLQWKIHSERGQKSTEDLKKYIQMCKSSGEVDKRMFKWNPFYCSELPVAEDLLRKEEV